MMKDPNEFPDLQHELHEWIEIQVWQQDRSTFVVSGSYSSGGQITHRYDNAPIAFYSTRDNAIKVGKTIAQQASAARLIFGLPYPCNFKEGEP